jgi:hypothetical protein
VSTPVVIHAHEVIDGVVHRRCPNCQELKPLGAFGVRSMPAAAGPVVREQSWCRACRSRPRPAPQ